MKQRFLVIGIGQLGSSLVRNLYMEGAEVLALDTDQNNIDAIKSESTLCAVGDCMDINTLKEIGAESVDSAIICMGTNFEGSVLALTNLLQLKVPHIAVRASTQQKAQILKNVGAHEVFFVEDEMGKILAHSLTRPNILHTMDLGYNLKIIEWVPSTWANGQKLTELNFQQKFNVQIIALRNLKKPREIINPEKNIVLTPDHVAILFGSDSDLNKLINHA
ncbi:MAG: potassium channel family protein [Pseudobdellovibrio sp.]